jgi:uncharacterized protein YjbI with pentapeptide repeats
MANEDHIAQLMKGVDAWNGWREENPHIHPDLSAAHLFGANLPDANLSHADLHGASLIRADLYGADLHGANLAWALLVEASLFGANLA